jgi:hypothetical protein
MIIEKRNKGKSGVIGPYGVRFHIDVWSLGWVCPSSSDVSSSDSFAGGMASFAKRGWGCILRGAPVLEKAPDCRRNSQRASIPFGVPRISARDSSGYYASLSMSRYPLYLGHSMMTCSRVSRFREFHYYRCKRSVPWGQIVDRIRLCMHALYGIEPFLSKISRSLSSFRKRSVGFSEGGMRLEMANLPSIERLSHSRSHGLSGAFLALLIALLRVTPIGDVQARFVACLASSVYLLMSSCAAHQFIETVEFGFASRKARILRWKLCE